MPSSTKPSASMSSPGSTYAPPPLPRWDAVVVTARDAPSADALQKELKRRQDSGWPSSLRDSLLLAVEDPAEGVGSGAATLNALLSVGEHLSAKKGFSVLNSDVFQGVHVLIVHMGREFLFDPCGRGMTVVSPAPADLASYLPIWLPANLDRLILAMGPCLEQPAGVWIASSDMVIHELNLREAFANSNCFVSQMATQRAPCPFGMASQTASAAERIPGAIVLSIPATVETCLDHGVFRMNDDGTLKDIVYQGTQAELDKFLEEDRTKNGSDALPLVAGIVYFSPIFAERVMSLHLVEPLDAATYLGQDTGSTPVGLSLFFDFLLPLSSTSLGEFLARHMHGHHVKPTVRESEEVILDKARKALWENLHGYTAKVLVVPGGRLEYLSERPKNFLLQMRQLLKGSPPGGLAIQHSFVEEERVSTEAIISNSYVGAGVSIGGGSFIQHCDLKGNITIGNDCIIGGLNLHLSASASPISIPDGTVFLLVRIRVPAPPSDHTFDTDGVHGTPQRSPAPTLGKFLVFYNIHDDINMPLTCPNATFLGKPLSPYMESLGNGLQSALTAGENTTLWSWKTFPVLLSSDPSLVVQHFLRLIGDGDVITLLNQCRNGGLTLSPIEAYFFVDVGMELEWRRKLFWSSLCAKINKVLIGGEHVNLSPYFNQAVLEGKEDILLDSLDATAEKCSQRGMDGLPSLTRTLAAIADVLGCLAKNEGGLRSGPAGNRNWQNAFAQIAVGDLTEGIRRLSAERRHWMDRPHRMVRAARHYEGAAQILIRQSVLTAKAFVGVAPKKMIAEGGMGEESESNRRHWIVAECPARLDLSGGWSDTPPLTLENKEGEGGGRVTNVAILIDQKRPIGAKVRRIDEPVVRICFSADGSGGCGDNLELSSLEEFRDFNQPTNPGALAKTAFIFTGVIQLPELIQLAEEKGTAGGDEDARRAQSVSLADQLMQSIGSPGVELRCWSNLPHGSGLGTSSILAAAILAALYELRGFDVSPHGLIHAVLIVEQMLTTGGGWQDQVGGLFSGFKMGFSKPEIPLHVQVAPLEVDRSFASRLNDHLLLLYTGKTRLARNLLQEVLRRWFSREPEMVANTRDLVENAAACARSLVDGDMAALGACMDAYWAQKKRMAPSCDPAVIHQAMEALQPHVFGQTLLGAGGGGFMLALTKEPLAGRQLVAMLQQTVPGTEGFEIFPMSIDEQGLQVYRVASDGQGGPVVNGGQTYIMA